MMPVPTISVDLRVYLLIAAVVGTVSVILFLDAIFRREAVKRDLRGRGCTPLHIWWRPLAYWATRYRSTPFRVIYRDAEDRLHKAYCCVYTCLTDSPFGSRRVEWIKDELRDFIDV
jgi:hypothetical protein